MKLTEKPWGGYKGKYKNHKVEIDLYENNSDKYGYKIIKDDTVYYSINNGLTYESKEEAMDAAINKIDEMSK